MKIRNMLNESMLFEAEEVLAEEAATMNEYLDDLVEELRLMREAREIGVDIGGNLEEIESELEDLDVDELVEAVQRQFRRYGDKFLRQYRCTTGPKAGRMVSSPEKCGIRKDPRRVRIGKKAARVKKGQRVRKSLFTKRKTQSKRLSRLNKVLRGDK